jgi:hypothetical protein
MKEQKLSIRAWRNFSDFESINIAIIGENIPEVGVTSRFHINDKFEKIEIKNNYYHMTSTLILTSQDAQNLVNDLWDAGIRPIAAKGSSGQLEAVEKHLKDMRTIAFERLNIQIP